MSFIKKHAVPIALIATGLLLVIIFYAELVVWFYPGSQTSHSASRPASMPASNSASHPASKAASRPGEIAYYTCSMHPSVKQHAPGTCPICAMDLTAVTKEAVQTGVLFVDAARRQRIGVRTAVVAPKRLERTVRAVGVVAIDETRLAEVNLRMSGWVQWLLVDETGQRVQRGQTLFTVYSPELYAAQIEHLSALSKRRGPGRTFAELAEASRQRLKLLGVSDAQIRALEERKVAQETLAIKSPARGFILEKNLIQGARIKAGTQVYRIADLSRVWVHAQIFESDLFHIREGQSATVTLHEGALESPAKVDYVHPTLEEKSRTAQVRLVLPNPEHSLKPGMYTDVTIHVPLGERLAVPESAVVYTGPRRLVFIDLGQGRLQPKIVQLGTYANGYYEVRAGLSSGDVVVTSGNFLIAAESRIRSAAKYWEARDGAE